jgi:DNA polymerase I-like protein with 3'-5' exonuclease and polymerase domains
LAGSVPRKRNSAQASATPICDGDHKGALDVLRRLKNAGVSVIWDGQESRLSFDAASQADQAIRQLYAESAARVDNYLAAELPEFTPAEQTQARRLVRELAVEVVAPSNPEDAATAIAELIALSGEFGLVLDIETAALPPWREHRPPLILRGDGSVASKQHRYTPDAALDPHRSRIRLIQIASAHRPGGPNRVVVIDADIIPVADAALLPVWRSKLWIHNAAFDVKHLIAAGIDLGHAEVVDTMLLAGMVHRCEPNPYLPAPSRPSLAKYAKAAAGIDLPKSGQVSDWGRPLLSRDQLNYAALDVAVLAYLIPKSWDRLPDKYSQACVMRASAAVLAVARLEIAGMAIDPVRLEKAAHAWDHDIDDITAKITAAGGPPRPNSSTCVARWLAQALPPEIIANWPRTPNGALSTESKVLRRSVEYHPAIGLLVARAKIAKMVSNFGRPLLAKINPVTGRLHCNLKISGAKSGRFSCANPNLQQIPARGELGAFMRSIFIASPGHILIGADYSQLELRVLAAVSGDAAMNAAFTNGQDLHAITACAMLHIDPNDFDKDNPAHKAARASAKAVNFGIIFGCGAGGLAAFARDAYGVSMTQTEAANAITRFLNTYEDVASWMERAADEAKLRNCVRTAGGRIYPASYEPGGKISRQLALNLPVQGAAAEVALEAIIRIEKALRAIPGARLIAQVHDEFLLEVVDDPMCIAEASAALTTCMREGFAALFPQAPQTGLVDVGVGRNWAELK